MRVVRCVALWACCLALAGCSHFGKKTAGGGARPAAEPAPRTEAPPVASRPSDTSGILAGQVIDGLSRKPAPVLIQVSMVRQGNDPPAAPIEVAADTQGYFTIQGLQPGRHYQLLARIKDGNHVLAGTVWATPPNPRVVIRVSEDNATPQTPPVPPVPPYPGTKPPPPDWPEEKEAPKPVAAEQGWGPTAAPPAARPLGAGLGNPVKIDDDSKPAAPVRPESTASGPGDRRAPTISIRGGPAAPPTTETSPPPAQPPAEAPPAPPAASVPAGVSAPVPFCALTGQQLSNFALNDVDGHPWEYRQQHPRLLLIDFWGSWCTHCLHAIPHLKVLQEKYGNYGLQVVGIAYEQEGPAAEQVRRVNAIRQRYLVSYPVLMGGDMHTCPVLTQFNVKVFPTMVLVDDTGRIVWRGQGLDKQKLTELELLVRQKLGIR